MAYNAKTQSVAAHTGRLLDQDSSYMQQARTQGMAAGNRRGLLNSSMSAQAGEASARNAVMPIATQDSAQDYGYGMQQTEHAHQKSQLSRQLSSQAALQAKQLEFNRWSQEAGQQHQSSMQESQFGHNTAMQGNQYAHETATQVRGLDHKRGGLAGPVRHRAVYIQCNCWARDFVGVAQSYYIMPTTQQVNDTNTAGI